MLSASQLLCYSVKSKGEISPRACRKETLSTTTYADLPATQIAPWPPAPSGHGTQASTRLPSQVMANQYSHPDDKSAQNTRDPPAWLHRPCAQARHPTARVHSVARNNCVSEREASPNYPPSEIPQTLTLHPNTKSRAGPWTTKNTTATARYGPKKCPT